MIGFDFDGVVTTGKYNPRFTDVIITACGIDMFAHVIRTMKELNVACPVYFNPNKDINRTKAAIWKSEMINKLSCDEFYEDDQLQYEIIRDSCSNCMVFKV